VFFVTFVVDALDTPAMHAINSIAAARFDRSARHAPSLEM